MIREVAKPLFETVKNNDRACGETGSQQALNI